MSRKRLGFRVTMPALLVALASLLTIGSGPASAAKPTNVLATFDVPGSYAWAVPNGVKRVTFDGWFGGGGGGQAGSAGGGGGGSGYITPLAVSGSFESGVRVGNGEVVITKA